MKKIISFLVTLVLIALLTGCTSSSLNTSPLSEEMAAAEADFDYMEKLVQENGGRAITLDLSNEKQYQFLLNHFKNGTKKEESSPQFFKSIQETRKRHLKGQINRGTTTGTTLAKDFFISSAYSDDKNFYISAISTVKGGSSYSYVDVTVFDESGETQLCNPYWAEEYEEGTQVTAEAIGNLPASSNDDGLKIVTVYAVEYTDVGGESAYRYITAKVLLGEKGIKPKFYIQAPVDKNNDNIIKVCIDRGGCADCDYERNFQYAIKVPFKGYLRVPYTKDNILSINQTQTYIKLSGPVSGGSTEMSYTGNDSKGLSTVLSIADSVKPTSILSWDIPRDDCWFKVADIPIPQNNDDWTAKIYDTYKLVNWYIQIGLKVKRQFGPMTKEYNVIYCATSDANATQPQKEVFPPPLQFAWSCLAKGSLVTLADGKLVPVEKVRKGDLVRTKGADLTVVEISTGIEEIPMIHIATESGHSLMLTETHPVMTLNRGIIWAVNLKEGDLVMTEMGPSRLRYAGKQDYDDTVYNLRLGTETELSAMTDDADSMFYAQGILVGDYNLQAKYQFINTGKTTTSKLENIPDRWKKDYLNSQS